MNALPRLFALAVLSLLLLASPASASESNLAIFGGYYDGFRDYWKGAFQRQNGITLAILAVGAVALFIITRGKWHK